MNQVVVYESNHPFAKRRFELRVDSIRALGSRNFVEFDITVPLARIDSRFDRLWLHSPLCYAGVWLVLIAVVLLLAIVTFVEMQDYRGPLSRPFGLVGSVGATGLALALLNRRKIEHVQFRTDAGMPVLAIPHDRTASGEFEQFVRLLIERINKARGEPIPPHVMLGE